MIGQDGLLAFDRLAVPRAVLPVRGHYHPLFTQRMPSFFPSHTLEFDSRAELYRARIEHFGGFAEVPVSQTRDDRARVQIDAIEQIVEFSAELEARAFLTIKPGDVETSSEAEVDELQSRPPECVAPKTAASGPTNARSWRVWWRAGRRRISLHAWRQREIRRRHESVEKIG